MSWINTGREILSQGRAKTFQGTVAQTWKSGKNKKINISADEIEVMCVILCNPISFYFTVAANCSEAYMAITIHRASHWLHQSLSIISTASKDSPRALTHYITILSLAAISAHLCLAEAFPIQCHFLQWPWRSKHGNISRNTCCKVVEFSEMSLPFVKRCCVLWNVFSVMSCFLEMVSCFLKWFLDLRGHSTQRLRY